MDSAESARQHTVGQTDTVRLIPYLFDSKPHCRCLGHVGSCSQAAYSKVRSVRRPRQWP